MPREYTMRSKEEIYYFNNKCPIRKLKETTRPVQNRTGGIGNLVSTNY